MTDARTRRRAILDLIESKDNLYQFGDPHNQQTTNHGNYSSTGCGHAGIVLGVRVWHGIEITIDDVSRQVGYTEQQKEADQGLTGNQLDNAFSHYDLPYRLMVNPNPDLLRTTIDNYGPVFMAVGYDNYPEWKGYVYRGTKADGDPNGYALPKGRAGRNQLTNAGFGHFITAFGHRDRKDIQRGLHRYWLHDPNHKSDARPESDPVDFVTEDQLFKMLWRFTHFSKNANVPVVWVPQRVWSPR